MRRPTLFIVLVAIVTLTISLAVSHHTRTQAVVPISSAIPPAPEENSYEKNYILTQQDAREQLRLLGANMEQLRNPFRDGHEYATDGKKVYWIWPVVRELPGADPDDLAYYPRSNRMMVTSRGKLYLTGDLQDVDLATLEGVGHAINYVDGTPSYYRDSAHVYYLEFVQRQKDYRMRLSPVIGADPHTFSFLNDSYGMIGKDARGVYSAGKLLEGFDAATFLPIKNCSDRCQFFADKNGLYVILSQYVMADKPTLLRFSNDKGGELLLGSDQNSAYVKTDTNVYLGTSTIDGADPATFAPLPLFDPSKGLVDTETKCTSAEACPYTRDAHAIYYRTKRIPADPKTFKLILPTAGESIKVPSGELRQYEFGADAKHVFYKGDIVENADPASFHLISSGAWIYEYAADDNHAFYHAKLIKGADPRHFKALGAQQPYEGCADDRYGTDGINVFFESELVPGADAKTFESHFHFGKDKLHYYLGTSTSPVPLKDKCDFG